MAVKDIFFANQKNRPFAITSLLGLVFRRRRVVFILLAMPPTSRGGRRWCCGVADSSLSLKPQTKTVPLVCKNNIFDCHNLSATFTNFAKQS